MFVPPSACPSVCLGRACIVITQCTLWLVHTADADETKLSCLVELAMWTQLETRQNCLVLSVVVFTVTPPMPAHRNWVETKQNCLVGGLNTIGDQTPDKIASAREQAIRVCGWVVQCSGHPETKACPPIPNRIFPVLPGTEVGYGCAN